ncbi:btaf1 RNA polymerase II, B-TFIID transcription factor-associated [Asimina triloba]
MSQQSSRLQRLLTLLDTGSTQATRFAAARQIGDVAKLHPQDLSSLLKKVSQYLRSKNWDTRVAAAHAVGAIADNVKHASLKEVFACAKEEMREAGIPDDTSDMVMGWSNFPETVAGLSFSSFEIGKVLEFGAPLLASVGQSFAYMLNQFANQFIRFFAMSLNQPKSKQFPVEPEYDITNDNSKNPAERIARQKQILRRRLGLDVCESFMDVNDMIRDEDLLVHKTYSHENGIKAYQNTQVLSDPLVDEDSSEHDDNGRWPFRHFVEQLIHDMFDPNWEVRHGSMMALREILMYQGASAGVLMPDLSSDISWFDEDDYKHSLHNTAKRSREIDLNMQFAISDSEPEMKRQKSEDFSSQYLTTVFPRVKEADTGAWCVSPELVNGGVAHVKSEPTVCQDGFHFMGGGSDNVVEQSSSFEDQRPDIKMGLLANLPDGCNAYEAAGAVLILIFHLACCHAGMRFMMATYCLSTCYFFQCRQEWEIRHGSLLGIKYLVAVRQHYWFGDGKQSFLAEKKYIEVKHFICFLGYLEGTKRIYNTNIGSEFRTIREMLQDLLSSVLPACKAGLADPDDDVRAVAAEALIPAASTIASLKGQTLHSIVMLLWDILLDLDDLSPSTSSVMNLLAEIYSQPEMAPKMSGASALSEKPNLDLNEVVQLEEQGDGVKYDENPYILSTLAPRLWPFMRHSITSVRRAAIHTLMNDGEVLSPSSHAFPMCFSGFNCWFGKERLLEAGCGKSSSETMASGFWPASILGDTLRIVFQNLLLESNEEILKCSERVWRLLLQSPESDLEVAAKLYFSSWIQLATTPYGSPLDSTKMFWPVALPRKSHIKAAAKMRAVKLENDYNYNFSSDSMKDAHLPDKSEVSSNFTKIIVGADNEKSVTHTRVVTATALGILASKLPEASSQFVFDPLWKDLTSLSGVQRQVASMVIVAWFKELKIRGLAEMHASMIAFVNQFRQWLLDLLACSDPSFPTKDSLLPYLELSRTYAKMRTEASLLFRAVNSSGMLDSILSTTNINLDTISIDDAIGFASKISFSADHLAREETSERQILDDAESSKQRLLSTSGYLKCVQGNMHVTVSALLAAAVVWMSELPSRLNPIILPLMAAVKREQEEILQQKAAEALAELVWHCVARKPSPNDKLIKNLCSLTCLDPCETPQAALISSTEIIEDQDLLSFGKATSSQRTKVQLLSAGEDRSKVEGFISRRGSELALKHLCERFGGSLFDKLPKLWDCLTEFLKPSSVEEHVPMNEATDSVKDPQALINNIQKFYEGHPELESRVSIGAVDADHLIAGFMLLTNAIQEDI